MSAREPWRLEAIHVFDCVEWHSPAGFAADIVSPGYALIRNDARLLHFAPRYLLAINQQGATPPMTATSGAIAIDVTGKWCGYRLHGSHAHDVLAAGTHADLVLAGRACAALSLFDCPIVLLRAATADEIWVPASYAESLCRALNKMENYCD